MDIAWHMVFGLGFAGLLYTGFAVIRDINIMKRQLARIDTKCFDPES